MSEFDAAEGPTTVDGVRAVEMRYRAVNECRDNDTAFFQTQMRLNSPSMGTLMPEVYSPVLSRSDRCIPIFRLALTQVLQASKRFVERGVSFEWISVPMPARYLRTPDCLRTVDDLVKKYEGEPEKICFELSPRLLEETDGICADSVSRLRSADYHCMITGFGADGFPLMRLGGFELDYVMLDGNVTLRLGRGERHDSCTRAMISFVNEYGAEPIATDVSGSTVCQRLYEMECSYYTGAYAGNFMQERYIRRDKN